MKSITTDQVGSKFGAAVAAVDITGDNYDEIFVGAALYSGDQTEEGRVFVYTTTNDVRVIPNLISVSMFTEKYQPECRRISLEPRLTLSCEIFVVQGWIFLCVSWRLKL